MIKKILGISITYGRMSSVAGLCAKWAHVRQIPAKYVILANTHMLVEAKENPDLRVAMKNSSLILPDGMPLVWCVKRGGAVRVERIAGPDLMERILSDASLSDIRHYFYGTTDEILQTLQVRLRAKYPHLKIVGVFSPPFRPLTPDEDADVVSRINASGADMLWVGLGCPKQEKWMNEHKEKLQVKVMFGVGQAINIAGGALTRAPIWMQKIGFEWLYRLIKHPRRLWKRYLICIPRFVYEVVKERLTHPKSAGPAT